MTISQLPAPHRQNSVWNRRHQRGKAIGSLRYPREGKLCRWLNHRPRAEAVREVPYLWLRMRTTTLLLQMRMYVNYFNFWWALGAAVLEGSRSPLGGGGGGGGFLFCFSLGFWGLFFRGVQGLSCTYRAPPSHLMSLPVEMNRNNLCQVLIPHCFSLACCSCL